MTRNQEIGKPCLTSWPRSTRPDPNQPLPGSLKGFALQTMARPGQATGPDPCAWRTKTLSNQTLPWNREIARAPMKKILQASFVHRIKSTDRAVEEGHNNTLRGPLQMPHHMTISCKRWSYGERHMAVI